MKISVLGKLVRFCVWTSQEIVAMLVQDSVSGQQSPDEELSKDIQIEPAGHLKLSGSFGSTAEQEIPSCLRKMVGGFDDARAASEAEV